MRRLSTFKVANSRLDPRTLMPSSHIGIILVAIAQHHLPSHWCSYVADRLYILCYNWKLCIPGTEEIKIIT